MTTRKCKMHPDLHALRAERVKVLADHLSAETGIPAECILSRDRDREVMAARHRLWAMLYDTGLSYPVVAELVGFDHTSVMNAVRKIRERAKRSA